MWPKPPLYLPTKVQKIIEITKQEEQYFHKKSCLERQPSSVPFIVQNESRNNQVHFSGSKDRYHF